MSAREEMLAAVRAALGKPPSRATTPTSRTAAFWRPPTPAARPTMEGCSASAPPRPPDEAIVERFLDRVNDYQARARRVPRQELAGMLNQICAERGAQRIALAPGLRHIWPEPSRPGIAVDDGVDIASLVHADGACTGCQVAIAETGTLVLDGGPLSGPRALSLIPDLHICVLETAQIVADVPDALELLDPTTPLTWISGPSATSDIELDRVEGVHGPRALEVLVVRSP